MKSLQGDSNKSFLLNPFNGERSRWELYFRAVKTSVKVHPDIPSEWKNYLFTIYPTYEEPAERIGQYNYPEEFQNRDLLPILANNANPVNQKNRNDLIRRDKEFNKEVGKAISLHTGILTATCSESLNEIFAERFSLDPYLFFRYLQTTYGPESNANEDRSNTMHQLLSLKMKSMDAFDSFMVSFNNKTTYLGLNDHAKRGLLTSTLGNTDGKVQLLPDRLIKELKHVREQDLNYDDTVIWLKRQDIRQANDGVSKVKNVKTIQEKIIDIKRNKELAVTNRWTKKEPNLDGDGSLVRPKTICHNCGNYGHTAHYCKTSFCCDCIRSKPEHQWSDCPKRVPRNLKKRAFNGKTSSAKTSKDNNDYPKKKLKSSIKHVTYEDTEEDESLKDDLQSEIESELEDIYEADQDMEEAVPSFKPRKSRRVRLRVLKLVQRKLCKISSTSPIRALIDSGAQVHATRQSKFLSHVIGRYDDESSHYVTLAGASGEDLGATAYGIIEGLESEVVVAKIEDDIIISTIQQSKAQLWTVHPPTGLIPGVGVIVFEHNPVGTSGKIIMVGDEEMYTNPKDWNKLNVTVDIPEWATLGSALNYKNI